MKKLTEDELIATLQAVHIHGSYMAASRAMYYTTRAIQYRIRILQARHGQPLVIARRGNRPGDNRGGGQMVTLTEYGKRIAGVS